MFKTPVLLSQAQVAAYRAVASADADHDFFPGNRPLQPLNGRQLNQFNQEVTLRSGTPQTTLNFAAFDTAPRVSGPVLVGDGSGAPEGSAGQRSMVRTLIVPLSTTVPGLTAGQKITGTSASLQVGGLELALRRLQGGPAFTVFATYEVINGAARLVLTFAGGSGATQVIGGSLADGDYRLTFVRGFQGNPGEFAFHRLFGDSDGDCDVDTQDLARFFAAVLGGLFRRGPSSSYFDFNGDGVIGTYDTATFLFYLGFKRRL